MKFHVLLSANLDLLNFFINLFLIIANGDKYRKLYVLSVSICS